MRTSFALINRKHNKLCAQAKHLPIGLLKRERGAGTYKKTELVALTAMGVNHAYSLDIEIISFVGNKKNIIYIEASIDHSIPLEGWRGGDCDAVGGVGGT